MTRDERIQAVRTALGDLRSVISDTLAVQILDAALADLGGLDGLADMVGSRLPLAAERVALRADRDRLREAVRLALTFDPNPMGDGPHWSVVEDALRESEATHG